MTHKEMSEIFAVMLLAYPNAEVFKGGIAKLGPTINLWVTCLPEIDFWTGQQAVVKLVRECKFPPTIAEFKEKAEAVQAEVKARIGRAWDAFKLQANLGKTPLEFFAGLPADSNTRRAIEMIGGKWWRGTTTTSLRKRIQRCFARRARSTAGNAKRSDRA